MIAVGEKRQLDDGSKSLLVIVPQGRALLAVHLLHIGRHCIGIPRDHIFQELFAFLQAQHSLLVGNSVDHIGKFRHDLVIGDPSDAPLFIVGQVSEMGQKRQHIVRSLEGGEVVFEAAGFVGDFQPRRQLLCGLSKPVKIQIDVIQRAIDRRALNPVGAEPPSIRRPHNRVRIVHGDPLPVRHPQSISIVPFLHTL